MAIKRRNFLRQLTGGVAASAVLVSPRLSLSPGGSQGERSGPGEHPLFLDRNENAYGHSRRVHAAVRAELLEINRFPSESENILSRGLAEFHHKRPEQILVGAGSNAILQMAAAVYLAPERRVVLGTPGYGALERYARARGAAVEAVPLRKDHSHDLEAMLAKSDSSTGLVYICNPNNPTATLTERSEIDRFLEKLPESVPVIIDEAYHEYAGGSKAYVSLIDRPPKPRQGVIVLRTFSKAYGLAGLRLGYAISDVETAWRLASIRPLFAVNRLALAAGMAAIRDREHIADCVRRNRDDRQEFVNQANARMLRVLDPHANFACLNVMRPSPEVLEHYRKHQVRLGPEIPSMPNHVRVSFGKPAEMREFWRVWDLLGAHPMAM
jgi:histidinol-phosphate aminotransferase